MNGFAIIEQMGHRRFGARVEETTVAGAAMLRCTILREGGDVETIVHPQSLFALTPCTEEQARRANTDWSSYVPSEVRALPVGDGELVRRLRADAPGAATAVGVAESIARMVRSGGSARGAGGSDGDAR